VRLLRDDGERGAALDLPDAYLKSCRRGRGAYCALAEPACYQRLQRQEANAGIECINCSVCYAACDTVAGNPDYLGPAALQRAWTLLNDAKDEGRVAILDAVSGSGGCHNCHSMGSCTVYCPNELDPMSAIAGLKRETMRNAFRRR